MSEIVVGYDGIHPILKNSSGGGCYEYWDENDPSQGTFAVNCPISGGPAGYSATPTPTYPVGGGIGVIQPGGSWYNDLLNTILGLSALGSHGSIGAGGINQQQYPQYPYGNPYGQGQLPAGQGGIAVNAGNTLGTFVQKNAVVLLIAGGIFLLYKSGRK